MHMHLVVQTPSTPEQILRALGELAEPSITEIRFGVAYATYTGSKVLCEVLISKIGDEHWNALPKTLISCVDYGITEPSALSYWKDLPNTNVMLRNIELLSEPSLIPLRAFHTKFYEFRRATETSFATGSANLTERALISNTEILAVHTAVKPVAAIDESWKQLLFGAVPATSSLILDYSQIRQKTPRTELPLLPDTNFKPQETLWQLIEAGACDPGSFDNFWVDSGAMRSGGAHNQLELPRGANFFFGFDFNKYGSKHDAIGDVTLKKGEGELFIRPLNWHGDNGMERLYLPTGYEYSNAVILFRRRDDGVFEMTVADSGSNRVNAWKDASAGSGRYFRVGSASPRTCGLF